jgi:hypothetical protein
MLNNLIFMELESSLQIFEKILNVQFNVRNRPVGDELFQADGQTKRT